jgi:hypothetical protein
VCVCVCVCVCVGGGGAYVSLQKDQSLFLCIISSLYTKVWYSEERTIIFRRELGLCADCWFYLLTPQSFDWSAGLHLELLQAILFIALCHLLCFWRIPLSIVFEVFPRRFFRILLLQGCFLQTRYA